jgi:AcrR family transcriptional regulator
MARPVPKRQRRKEARPAEIRAAALQVFSERGFAAARLEDVAEVAGVSKATIYLYFESKADLFAAIVREIATPRFDAIEKLIDTHEGPSGELIDFILARLQEVATTTELPALLKIILAEAGNFLLNTIGRNTFGAIPQLDPGGFFSAHAEFVRRGLAADRGA